MRCIKTDKSEYCIKKVSESCDGCKYFETYEVSPDPFLEKIRSQGFTEGQRDMLKKCVEIIKKDALRWENDVECAGLCSVNAVIEELQALGGKE